MKTTSPRSVHGIQLESRRLRQALLREGPDRLSTAELLGICLGDTAPGNAVQPLELPTEVSTSDDSGNSAVAPNAGNNNRQIVDATLLAHQMLTHFAGLEGLLAASGSALTAFPGVGLARAARLKAIAELNIRRSDSQLKRDPVYTNVDDVSKYLQRQIGHLDREVFGCMFLDSRHRLISWEVLFLGSINRAHVHAREILRRGLQLNCAAVILAHNHPSGMAEPSQADLLLTRELSDLLARVDIRVLDHIVVAGQENVSFAARGLL